MRAVDLFAGCGGASLGMAAAGVDVVLAVEKDKKAAFAHACMSGLHARVACMDVADLAERPFLPPEGVDLVWASPPCQPFSAAGDRLGSEDPRNGYPALLRALRVLEPRWVIIENVKGLASHSKNHEKCRGCYNDHLIAELTLRFNSVQQGVLDAAWFGVPQHRERLFTVCGPTPIRWPFPTHGPSTRPDNPLRYRSAGDVLALADGALAVGGPNASGGRGPAVTSVTIPAPVVRARADIYLVAAGLNKNGGHNEGRPRSLDLPSPSVTGRATAQLVRSSDGETFERIRTLTVKERALLQCLPWNDALTGKMVGNAVPPPLAEAITRAVQKAEAFAAGPRGARATG